MAVTVEDFVERLNAEAARFGVSADKLLDELLARLPEKRRRRGFVSLGASTAGRSARGSDDLLAEGFGRS